MYCEVETFVEYDSFSPLETFIDFFLVLLKVSLLRLPSVLCRLQQ